MPRDPQRIEFLLKVTKTLAERAGMRCSHPDCRRLTCGPRSGPDKTVNVGEAAHITAASPKGPRYDPSLTDAQRGSIENGIWLCSIHAKLIDNDSAHFTVEMLCGWKREAEARARHAVEIGEQTNPAQSGDSLDDRAAKRVRLVERTQARLIDYKSACAAFFWPPQKPDGPAWQRLEQETWKVRDFLEKERIFLPPSFSEKADALLEHVSKRYTAILKASLLKSLSPEQRAEEYKATYSFANHNLPNCFKELTRSLQSFIGELSPQESSSLQRERQEVADFKSLFGFKAGPALRAAVTAADLQLQGKVPRQIFRYANRSLQPVDGRLRVMISRDTVFCNFMGTCINVLTFIQFVTVIPTLLILQRMSSHLTFPYMFYNEPFILHVTGCVGMWVPFFLVSACLQRPYQCACRLKKHLDSFVG